MTLDADEFIRRFLLHVLPKASVASVTSDFWQTPAAPKSSRPSVRRSRLRRHPRLRNMTITANAVPHLPDTASINAPSAEAA